MARAWKDVEDMGMMVQMVSMGVDAGSLERQRAAKVKDGAEQFEGMMLGEMMKGLKFGQGVDGEESGGDSSVMTGFGTEALAHAVAKGGGFGIAREMVRQIGAEDEAVKKMQRGTKVL